jgi:hypothetical protein
MANADNKGTYTDDRTTHLTLSLSAEPASISGTQDALTSSWANDTLTLELSHAAGAANVVITP